MSLRDIDEDMRNSEDSLFDQEDSDHNSRGENTPTPDANPDHAQPEDIEIPEWASHVQSYLNTVLPHLVDTIYHRIQAANAIQSPPMRSASREVQMDNNMQRNNATPSPPMQSSLREVQMDVMQNNVIPSSPTQSAPQELQMDSDMPDHIRVPTETNMQQVINYAISAAIPSLITAVDERVGTILGTAVSTMEAAANRVEVATHKRARNPQRSNNRRSFTLDEYDGDIEATPRKSNGPKSTKINKQHEYIRKWLADRGVLRTKDSLPTSATDEDVAAFDVGHVGGPATGLPIKIHWKSGFSSDWNRQAIFVLVSDFLAEHTACAITRDDLQDLFGRKLERTRREWLLTQTAQTGEFERLQVVAAKKNRRRGRFHGTYYRRGYIIDKYFDNNPAFWGQVQNVYDLLGPDGMSSDETDAECTPGGIKTVRRIARVWLSEEISFMWDQIENYHHDREGPKQGNKAFGRTFAPKNSSSSKAIRCLPRNYYNSLWWMSLISVDQHHLSPGDEVALPDFTVLQGTLPNVATAE